MKKQAFVAVASATALSASFLMSSGAFAFDAGNIADASELKECLGNSGITCKLSENIILDSTIDVPGTATLDLNGKKITADSDFSTQNMFIVHRGGNLTINDATGKGLISGEEGTVPDGYGNKYPYSVVMLTAKADSGEEFAKLTVNGGTLIGNSYAIVGNGNRHNTDITVNGGTIKGTKEGDSLGIYHPQNGTLTINGGTVTGGSSGIEMRAGKLSVNGGTITGRTAEETVSTKNGSGNTTKGAGIVVAQHSTNLPISVDIKGGDIEGTTAFYQKNVEENSVESVKKISLNIQAGTFTGKTAVYSENNTSFVSGGTFSTEPKTEYIVDGYYAHKYSDTKYVVEKITNIDPEEVAAIEEALGVSDLRISVSPVPLSETTKKLVDGLKIDDLQIAGALEIKLTATNETGATEVHDTEGKMLTFAIEIPEEYRAKEGFRRMFYLVRIHEYEEGSKAEIIPLNISEDGKTATFKSDKFSDFVLAYTETEIPTEEPTAEVPAAPNSGFMTKETSASTSFALTAVLSTVMSAAFLGIKKFAKKND